MIEQPNSEICCGFYYWRYDVPSAISVLGRELLNQNNVLLSIERRFNCSILDIQESKDHIEVLNTTHELKLVKLCDFINCRWYFLFVVNLIANREA